MKIEYINGSAKGKVKDVHDVFGRLMIKRGRAVEVVDKELQPEAETKELKIKAQTKSQVKRRKKK